MKKIKFILFLFFLTTFICCRNDGRVKLSDIEEIKKLVIDKGDRDAYYSLLLYYEGRKEYEAILPYAIVMSYKYNNEYTYFEIYATMIKIYNEGLFDYKGIKNLDSKSQKFAIDNLLEGAKLGDISSKKYLAKYYEEGVYLPKNIKLAEKLEYEINHPK